MAEPDLRLHVTQNQLSAMSKGMKLAEISAAHGELEALCNRKIEAAEDFSNCVKLTAMKSGVDPSVLSTYITAVVNDTLKKKQGQAEQLSILFDEMP